MNDYPRNGRVNGHQRVSDHESAETLLQKHLPPHDVHQEQMALGCILHEFARIDELRSLQPDMFWLELHQLAFDELRKWRASSKPFDVLQFAKFLGKAHPQESGVWDRTISEAYESVPHGAHAFYQAGKVQELWIARQSICIATDLIRSAHESTDFATDLAGHQIALQRLSETGEDVNGVAIQPALLALMERWEIGEQAGLPTGFPQFDRIVRLLAAGVYVIAGRPGQGKSGFALAIAEYVSRTAGVLIFSLEMSRFEVLARLVSRVIEIPVSRIAEMVKQGRPPEKLTDAVNELSQRTFLIDDRDHMTADQMAATARVHAAKHKLRLIIIDYCQLITPRDRRVNREQQIAEISRSIKQLAKQVNLPILLLSQMSRSVELREGKWPQLSDLRESGAIENDADGVIFIHDESPKVESGTRTLVIRKNRNGQNEGVVPVEWLPQFTTFKPIKQEWHSAEGYDSAKEC